MNKPNLAVTWSVFIVCAAMLCSGCAGGKRTLDPAGPYRGDIALYNADIVIIEVDKLYDDVVLMAERNPGPFEREAVLKDLLERVNKERDGKWEPNEVLAQLIAARDAYERSSAPPDAQALDDSIARARSLLIEIRNLSRLYSN